jgi:hypothetical protein
MRRVVQFDLGGTLDGPILMVDLGTKEQSKMVKSLLIEAIKVVAFCAGVALVVYLSLRVGEM